MSIRIITDSSGLWPPLPGWTVARDVADVVSWDPGQQQLLWVQGIRPATIALNIAHLWGWPTTKLPPPSQAVGTSLGVFWSYGDEAASKLIRLAAADPWEPSVRLMREPLIERAADISGGLVFWHLPVGRPEHLAELLRALFDRDPGDALPAWVPLCQALCLLWEREAGPSFGSLYRYERLDSVLRGWVLNSHRIPGLEAIAIRGIEQLPALFPDPVPKLARYWVRESWRRALSKIDDTLAFGAIIRLELGQQAAVESAAYALADTAAVLGCDRVPPQALAWLEQVARDSHDLVLERRARSIQSEQKPPSLPDLPAGDVNMEPLIQWGGQYVVSRTWGRRQGNRLSAEEAELCQRFGALYLGAYKKLVGQPRALARSTTVLDSVRDLLEHDQAVLWVVVDGLPYAYFLLLQEILQQEGSELALAEKIRTCGAVIPTDTEYAKWALYAGKLPAAAERLTEPHEKTLVESLGPWVRHLTYWTDVGRSLGEDAGPDLGRMGPRDCVVLDFLALDKEYGKHLGDPVVLDHYMTNTLRVIAWQILSAANLIPATLEDRWALIVTADHGAVLDPLPPLSVALSEGEMRGRLAVGLHPYPNCSYMALALQECGLPTGTPLSICLGPHRFSAQGVPVAPICGQHGSLWPEEVVVPLAVFRRTKGGMQQLSVEFAEGQAAAGAQGTISLQLRNPNARLAFTDLAVELSAFGESSWRRFSVKRLESGQLGPVERLIVDKWPAYLPSPGKAVGKLHYRIDVTGVEQAVDLLGDFHVETVYDSGFDALFHLAR